MARVLTLNGNVSFKHNIEELDRIQSNTTTWLDINDIPFHRPISHSVSYIKTKNWEHGPRAARIKKIVNQELTEGIRITPILFYYVFPGAVSDKPKY